jgi:hypothetical protein
MKTHKQQYMIPLFFYGDLSLDELREFKEHLARCEECRIELEETRRLHAFLASAPAPEPDEFFLGEARMQAHAAIRAMRASPSLSDKLRQFFGSPIFSRPAFGLAAIVLLLIGFAVGRLAFRSTGSEAPTAIPALAEEDVRVTNVQMTGGTGGEDIDLAFDTVTPVRLHGSLADPRIQKVLAYAMVNGENPGVRLRAVGSIASTSAAPPEREVKAALLLVLSSDQNDGVRKAALNALLRYPADREVRDALLNVLLNDPNPGLRVAAINGLDSLRVRGYQPDQGFLHTFKQRLQHDENLYVRVKAQSLLEGSIQ